MDKQTLFLEAESYCRYKCIWQGALACKPAKHHCPMYDFIKGLK